MIDHLLGDPYWDELNSHLDKIFASYVSVVRMPSSFANIMDVSFHHCLLNFYTSPKMTPVYTHQIKHTLGEFETDEIRKYLHDHLEFIKGYFIYAIMIHNHGEVCEMNFQNNAFSFFSTRPEVIEDFKRLSSTNNVETIWKIYRVKKEID